MTANIIPPDSFKRMEFNPIGVDGKMIEAYPKLRLILPEKGRVDDRVIRYIVLVYEANSPLVATYTQLSQRKEFAAALAGYNLEKKVDEDVATKMFDFSDDAFVGMVSRFLEMQNNRLWSLIVSNEQIFAEYQLRLLVPVSAGTDDKDKDVLTAASLKSKLRGEMREIHQDLIGYYRELTGDDPLLENKITKQRRVTPESISDSK